MNNRYMNIEEQEAEEPQVTGHYDPSTGQFVEDHFDDFQESYDVIDPATNLSAVRGEAVKRIQQAKLYETVLSNNLFAAGSADPEIQERVEAEIKDFILKRLEELLGMRQEASPAAAVELPFDDEQLMALQMIANRALKRGPALGSTPTPSIQPVQAEPPQPVMQQPVVQQPAIVQIQAPQEPQPEPRRPSPQRRQPQTAQRPQAQPAQRQVAPQRPQPVTPPGQKRPGSPRKATANQSEITGKELSQATSRRRRGRPMPSQAEQDALNARQAEQNARAPRVVPGEDGYAPSSGSVGQMLAKALIGSGG